LWEKECKEVKMPKGKGGRENWARKNEDKTESVTNGTEIEDRW
jgi:hypothetical protein